MNTTEADTILEALSGYWPTPALTDEEVKAWLVELCGPTRINVEEAAKVISTWARSGETFRLRPGQMVAEVHALRRRRALNTAPTYELPGPSDPDDLDSGLAKCRAALAAGAQAQAQARSDRLSRR